MDVLERLKELTHVVEYSPSCPSRYLVRLGSPGHGTIDKKSYHRQETHDILGLGRTLKEAARRAIIKQETAERRWRKRFLGNSKGGRHDTRKCNAGI